METRYTVEALENDGWRVLNEDRSRSWAILIAKTRALSCDIPNKGFHVYVRTKTGVRKHVISFKSLSKEA